MKLFGRVSTVLSLLWVTALCADEGYSWTGFYVGGFVGGASSSTTTSTEPRGVQTNVSWNYPYSSPFNYGTGSGFIGGGTIGYNWQLTGTPIMIGLEGEYGYLGLSGSSSDPNASANGAPGRQSANIGGSYGYGFIGARMGYVLNDILFYVKSGAIFTSTTIGYSGSFDGTSASWQLKTSSQSNQVGYGVGAGVEYDLPYEWADNFSVKVEYLYYGVGRSQSSAGYDSLGVDNYISSSQISGFSSAKMGMNYRF
jgi:outer membrane immunogenic protein